MDRFGWLAGLVLGACGGAAPPDVVAPSDTPDDAGPTDVADTDVADTDGPCLDGTAEVLLGPPVDGSAAFAPFAPGDDVVFRAGGGGGWDLDVALWTRHAPGLLHVTLRAHDRTTDAPLPLTGAQGTFAWNLAMTRDLGTPGCDAVWSPLDVPLDLPPGDDPERVWAQVADHAVTFDVEVAGPRGAHAARSTVEVVLRADPCLADVYGPGCPCDPARPNRPGWCAP